MFYLSIDKIKPFAMCPKGPEILKWFEDRFDSGQEIPLIHVYNKFGETHTVFCLRAVKGGPEFALDYAIKCVEHIRSVFEDEYPENPLLSECIETALFLKETSAKEAGHNMENFCRDKRTSSRALKAGFAASKLSYAAYTISQPHASVDFSLGAVEDARDAAKSSKLEDTWQSSLFKTLLVGHKDE